MNQKFVFKLLSLLALLPFGVLYLFADIISFCIYYVVKYRRKVVNKNLTEAFPEKSSSEIISIEKKFYRYLGDQIVETLKLIHLSDENLKERVVVNNYDLVNESLSEGRNAVLLLGHYNNWEWVQEITRYFLPESYMISIYHPLKNKTWDDFFIQLRSRWNAHIVPMKSATRILLNRQNFPWVCGFIADARPDHLHPEEDNVIDFLNHKTHFITGPEVIGDKTNADYFYLEMVRKKRGHYIINFSKIIPDNSEGSFPHLRQFWKEFEKTIEKDPAYWLWSHKRWK